MGDITIGRGHDISCPLPIVLLVYILALFMPTKSWHKMKNSGNIMAQTQDGSGEIQKIPTT